MKLPQFKYHPNAYELDIFSKEKGVCSICEEERDLKYTSSFYSIDEPEYICPWCIHDGSAALEYEGEFNDSEGIEDLSIDEELIAEVAKRTPSYTSIQQEVWLAHCNEPCAFIGYADSETIKPYLEELKPDIESNIGYDPEDIRDNLTKDGSLVGYLFQCVKCGQRRLHADSD
jgi:uncharacterized protein